MKRRPTLPVRYGERRCVEGWWDDSGLSPRALAITFVLPKKMLLVCY